MERAIKTIEALTTIVGGIAALLVIPLVLATAWEVFARYAFGTSTIWAFELGYTLMGMHFLLGGALALKRQVHVRIDLIYAQLTSRKRALVDLTLYLFVLLPALVMIVIQLGDYALESFINNETSGLSAWNPPIWPFRTVIVVSFAVLTLQVTAEILKCFQAILHKSPYPRG